MTNLGSLTTNLGSLTTHLAYLLEIYANVKLKHSCKKEDYLKYNTI